MFMGRSGFVSQSLLFIPCKCCRCFIISLYFGFDSEKSMFISTLKTFEFSVNFPDKSDISKSYTSSFSGCSSHHHISALGLFRNCFLCYIWHALLLSHADAEFCVPLLLTHNFFSIRIFLRSCISLTFSHSLLLWRFELQ